MVLSQLPTFVNCILESCESTYEDKEVQTLTTSNSDVDNSSDEKVPKQCRSLEDCVKIFKNIDLGATELTDDEIILLIKNKNIAAYQIEKEVDDPERGVGIRRKILGRDLLESPKLLDNLPFRNYDYSLVSLGDFLYTRL